MERNNSKLILYFLGLLPALLFSQRERDYKEVIHNMLNVKLSIESYYGRP